MNLFNRSRITCNVCGYRFKPQKESVYSIPTLSGLMRSFFNGSGVNFDAIDCPKCGSQNTLAERILSNNLNNKKTDQALPDPQKEKPE